MSDSKETAVKILDHLEASDKPGRGLNNAFGRVSRKQHAKLVVELSNIIDGKPAVPAESSGGGEAAASKAGGSKAGGSRAQA